MTNYNYDSFSSDDYEFDSSTGPAVGNKAPDFSITTSYGETRRLLDFEGDFLVLELGSITCPLFQSRRKIMSTLKAESGDVESVVLYVCEAHPGALIPSHKNFEDKYSCANLLKDRDGEPRTALVDDYSGSAHQAYGGMPNSVFIINNDGCILFKSEWNNPSATRRALNALIENRTVSPRNYFRPGAPLASMRTLKNAGKGAGLDFLRSFPSLIWNNLIKRNLRVLLNRPETVKRDIIC